MRSRFVGAVIAAFALSGTLLLSCAAVLAVPTAAAAAVFVPTSANDFEFVSFHADYYLSRDEGRNAKLRTVETLVANFPNIDQNHGIERAIPLKYGEARLELSVLSVTDDAGQPINYSRSDDGVFAVLRIGDADTYVHGTKTYRIQYTQENVIRSFSDTQADEFYWDVNGTGWAQPFGTVSATVHLEGTIASDLNGNLACYRGYEGADETCTISRSGDTIVAETGSLTSYENMTISIGFNQEAFVDPPLARNHWVFTVLPWVFIGITLLCLLVVVATRLFVWRDARGRGIIVPQYTPPKDSYPLLGARLLRRDRAGIPAQLVSFAVNRALKIREHPDKPPSHRYELEAITGWAAIRGEEKKALKAFLGPLELGQTQFLDSGDTDLGDRIATLNKSVDKSILTKQLRAKQTSKIPSLVRWVTFLSAGSAVAIWFISTSYDAYAELIWMSALACVVGWILTSALATTPYLLTDAGAELRDYLYGIRDYVRLAEADRIKMLQAPDTAERIEERIDTSDRSAVIKLYEKLLPYAMIFGIERDWIAELGRYYAQTQEPNWYAGTNFTSFPNFTTTVAATSFATTPPPPSSSSSWSSSGGSSPSFGGSSGGGFSGGGGGGGGGGGW